MCHHCHHVHFMYFHSLWLDHQLHLMLWGMKEGMEIKQDEGETHQLRSIFTLRMPHDSQELTSIQWREMEWAHRSDCEKDCCGPLQHTLVLVKEVFHLFHRTESWHVYTLMSSACVFESERGRFQQINIQLYRGQEVQNSPTTCFHKTTFSFILWNTSSAIFLLFYVRAFLQTNGLVLVYSPMMMCLFKIIWVISTIIWTNNTKQNNITCQNHLYSLFYLCSLSIKPFRHAHLQLNMHLWSYLSVESSIFYLTFQPLLRGETMYMMSLTCHIARTVEKKCMSFFPHPSSKWHCPYLYFQ